MTGSTTHILLLRHGQTDANATGVLQGHLPTPLNRLGIYQATLLANRLHSFRPPIEVLVSSDLPRATQTAGPIAAACGLKVHIDHAWRERSFGLLEGKSVGGSETWRAASGEIDAPGAEPIEHMHERVRRALEKLPTKYSPHRTIAVVTHGGPIRAILKMLANGRLQCTRGQDPIEVKSITNCSIMELTAREYRDGFRWKVDCVNDAAHLKEVATNAEAS